MQMLTPETRRESEVGLRARIRELAGNVLQDASLYVVDVEVRGRERVSLITVYVEGDDGVTIDQCAEISRLLDARLQIEGTAGADYRLDVSSPGLNRPLVLPRQYRRHVGRNIRLTLVENDGNEEVVEGKLVAAGEKCVTVETGSGTRDVQYGSIGTANVKLPW